MCLVIIFFVTTVFFIAKNIRTNNIITKTHRMHWIYSLMIVWKEWLSEEIEYENIVLKVEAPAWAFPEWTELRIIPITQKSEIQKIREWLKETTKVTHDSHLVSFDISFIWLDKNWQEVELEPADWKTVKVSFNYKHNDDFKKADDDKTKQLKIYHLEWFNNENNDENDTLEVKEVKIDRHESEDWEIVAYASDFSIYTFIEEEYNWIPVFFYDSDDLVYVWDVEMWSSLSSQDIENLSQYINSQWWKSFFWWYENGKNTNFDLETQITESIDLFASWNITSCNPYWTWCITIQDRNLWASTNDISSVWAYWYHYQRWNNYWFAPCLDSNWCETFVWWETSIQNLRVNTMWYGPWNWYNSWIFRNFPSSSPFDWADPMNDNLRWGSKDDQTNNWGLDLYNATDRQWPCPVWYHIPSAGEWNKLLEYWIANYTWMWNSLTVSFSSDNLNKFDDDLVAVNRFQENFKIPFAGYRDGYDAKVYDIDDYAYFWSSSPRAGYDYAYLFQLSNSEVSTNYYNNRVFGYSIRCFKDYPLNPYIISFWDWKEKLWDRNSNNLILPKIPEKTGYIFIWWYQDWESESYNFDDVITQDIDLYAKRMCDNWYHTEDNVSCILNTKILSCIEKWKPENSSYVKWNVKVTWSWTRDTWVWNQAENCEWTCDLWYSKSWDICITEVVYEKKWDSVWWEKLPTKSTLNTWEWSENDTKWTSNFGAKWTSLEYTILDQDPDFTYGEIEIPRPNSISVGPNSYIIMDRNLWASTSGTSIDSYGYYYQWWNNYWFPTTWNVSTGLKSVAKVNLTLYWPSSIWMTPYYSWVYVIAPNGQSNRNDWATTSNENIWWNVTNNNAARQWPCPDGWHIPSQGEWSDAINYWVWGGKTIDLKIPAAWNRARSDSLPYTNVWTDRILWSTTPKAAKGEIYILKYSSSNYTVTNYTNRVDGLPIRCFKNIIDCDSNEHIDGGECVSNIMTWFCMTWAEINNGNYTWMDKEISILWSWNTWDVPICDIECDEWYFIDDNQCLPEEDYNITFELNGWLWYDWYAGNRTGIVEAWSDASTARPIKDPYKGGYMFIWWFDDSNNSSARFKFEWTILTWNLTLTAHWLEFKDIVYTGIVDGTTYIVTLMDRNLWATATWVWILTTPETYWFYYQWWNNYGFYYDRTGWNNNTTGRIIYNTVWYGPWNWFYGENFTTSDADYSSSPENNLWWWSWDNNDNNYDNGHKKHTRQWPCPKGYHVPSLWEWHKLIRLFMNKEYPTHASTNILNTSWKTNRIWKGNDANYGLTQAMLDKIVDTFYIVSAWRVTYSYAWNRQWAVPGEGWYRAPFRSSTPIITSKGVRALWFEIRFSDIKFNLWWWDDERAGGKPVRCFKDMEDYTVTWKNYDETVLETDYYVYEWSTPSYDEPTNPIREGYDFTWWYLEWDETQTKVDLSEQSVNSNRAYVAKFVSIAPEDAYVVIVDVDPSNGWNVEWNTRYNSGDTITLTWIANPGYEFLWWFTGNTLISTANPYVFTADDSDGTGFTAVFSPLYSIYTWTNNGLWWTVSYEVVNITRQWKVVRFMANPAENFELDRWLINWDNIATWWSAQLDIILSWDINLTGYFIQVQNLPCEFSGQSIANWETVTWYQSDSVVCPNSCVSQVATCNNGVWSVNNFDTEYGYLSCTHSGFSCDIWEYPLQVCPDNWICSSCTGYTTNNNSCNQWTPIYKLDSCDEHYHVNGNACEIDSHTITILSNNPEYWTVTQSIVTWDYGSSIIVNNNEYIVTISWNTIYALPESWNAQYTYEFSGWNTICGNILTGDCTIIAEFINTLNIYTISFNSNGWNYTPTNQEIWYWYSWTKPLDPTKTWYEFDNWYLSWILFDFNTAITENILLEAQRMPSTNTPYTVEYYWENLNDSGYSIIDSGILVWTTEWQTNATARDYTWFTLSWSIESYQTEIAWDGSTVVKIYYTRNSYEVTFLNDWIWQILWNWIYKYGTKAEDIDIPENPERESTSLYKYIFIWWSPNVTDVVTWAIYMAAYEELPIPQIWFVSPTPAHNSAITQNRFTTKMNITNTDYIKNF